MPFQVELDDIVHSIRFTRDGRVAGFGYNWFDVAKGKSVEEPAKKELHPEAPQNEERVGKLLGMDDVRSCAAVDGVRVLVASSEDSFSAYNTKTKKKIRDYPRPGVEWVGAIRVTSDKKYVISLCSLCIDDDSVECVRVTELESGRELPVLRPVDDDEFNAIELSPDGAILAIAGRYRATIWPVKALLKHLAEQTDDVLSSANEATELREQIMAKRAHGIGFEDLYEFQSANVPGQACLKSEDSKLLYGVLRPEPSKRVGKTKENVRLKSDGGAAVLDVIGADNYNVAASARALAVLEQNGLTGWKRYPIEVKWGKSKAPDGPYTALQITAVAKAVPNIAETSSDWREFIDLELWDGSDFFRTETARTFVTSRVVKALQAAGVTGWKATHVASREEILGPTRAPKVAAAKTVKATKAAIRKPLEVAGLMAKEYEARLSKLIAKYELQRVEKKIRAAARMAIGFESVRANSSVLAAGASRFGGEPDLPAGEKWPALDGKPLSFLGQFRLDDLKDALPPYFPKTGLLSLFVELKGELGYQLVERGAAFYWKDCATLERREAPAELPDYMQGDAIGLRVKRILTVPDGETQLVSKEWKLSGDEYDAYLDLVDAVEELSGLRKDHRLGGWADWLQYSHFNEQQPLLIQVDTDPGLGTRWADGGILYAALSQKDWDGLKFGKAEFVTQFT